MTGIVLVIDDKERLGAVVEQALDGLEAQLQVVEKVFEAKQFLIQTRPGVVISSVPIGENSSAGFDFCKEMRGHTLFADLPVILVGEKLTEETIRLATESGAHGLVGWPVSPETLRKRLTQFLAESSTSAGESSAGSSGSHSQAPAAGGSGVHNSSSGMHTAANSGTAHQAVGASASAHHPVAGESAAQSGQHQPAAGASATQHQSMQGTSVGSSALHQAVGQGSEVDDKLKKAQMLLASVLHNLKTSNLLDVVEMEDVPGIVLQMARTVCGEAGPDVQVASSSSKAERESQQEASDSGGDENEAKADVDLNLDDVFGLKK